MDNDNMNESLLLRYLGNDVTEDEIKQIEDWLRMSDDNKQLVRDLYYIKFASETLNNMKTISADIAYAEVERKIKLRRWLLMLSKGFRSAAAVLFIPLLISVAYLLLNKDNGNNEYVELRTCSGMTSSVVLPDGSKVWLNSNTYLKYPVLFNSESREVELDGEAYFSVVKDEEKSFKVHTLDGEVNIEVLGTEFNVDAYKEHGILSATLVSGAVRLSYMDKRDNLETLDMVPDDKIVYDRDSRHLDMKRVDVSNDISWRDGAIVLNDTPINDVLWMLSKRFNVDFDVRSTRFQSSSFTGVFNDQQLDVILEHLKIASNIRYKIMPDTLGIDNSIKRRVLLY